MMAESIVLFGGPKDGAVIEVADGHPPLDYRIPIPLSIANLFSTPPDETNQPGYLVGIYAPRCDKYGHVECSLAGHPIYEWKGEQ